jgi:hypothetical protein
MHVAIPKKYTLFRIKLELLCIKWMKIGPTGITKGVKYCIVWFLLK